MASRAPDDLWWDSYASPRPLAHVATHTLRTAVGFVRASMAGWDHLKWCRQGSSRQEVSAEHGDRQLARVASCISAQGLSGPRMLDRPEKQSPKNGLART